MKTLKYWSNPLVYDPTLQKWFYWDETWAYRIGPFDTKEMAQIELNKYCEELNLNGYGS
jgi:hypothetical protein